MASDYLKEDLSQVGHLVINLLNSGFPGVGDLRLID